MRMPRRPVCLLLCLVFLLPVSACAKQLWLIGGGEPVCSSIETEFCVPEKLAAAEAYFANVEALREKQFRSSPAALQTLASIPRWAGDAARTQAIQAKLAAALLPLGGKTLGARDWHALLEPLGLGDEELGLVDDVFQARARRKDGSTQEEQVYLDGSADYVESIFRDFVAAAAAGPQRTDSTDNARVDTTRTTKPRIVILTASSNDAFEYVSYYLSLFEAAGAQASWLPLEPALIRAKDCSQLDALRFEWNGVHSRSAAHPEWAKLQRDFCQHPERMLQLVESADAFFINGGDQSLTLRSLQLQPGKFTPLAQRLLDRVAAGIPLGGSSAGTAVQSGNRAGTIPMFSGGQSAHALRHGALPVEANTVLCAVNGNCTMQGDADQLTYRPEGGLRVFSIGVADTHFHEREREGRLLRLLLDTKSRFGFGVDEATVLKADIDEHDNAVLQVMGHGGVWIVDTAGASTTTEAKQWSAKGFRATRLLAGDSARLKDGVLTVTLACDQPVNAADVATIATADYASHDGTHWQAQESPSPVRACQRADGRWRYDQLPLRIDVGK
jgi:cyanophycinase